MHVGVVALCVMSFVRTCVHTQIPACVYVNVCCVFWCLRVCVCIISAWFMSIFLCLSLSLPYLLFHRPCHFESSFAWVWCVHSCLCAVIPSYLWFPFLFRLASSCDSRLHMHLSFNLPSIMFHFFCIIFFTSAFFILAYTLRCHHVAISPSIWLWQLCLLCIHHFVIISFTVELISTHMGYHYFCGFFQTQRHYDTSGVSVCPTPWLSVHYCLLLRILSLCIYSLTRSAVTVRRIGPVSASSHRTIQYTYLHVLLFLLLNIWPSHSSRFFLPSLSFACLLVCVCVDSFLCLTHSVPWITLLFSQPVFGSLPCPLLHLLCISPFDFLWSSQRLPFSFFSASSSILCTPLQFSFHPSFLIHSLPSRLSGFPIVISALAIVYNIVSNLMQLWSSCQTNVGHACVVLVYS